MNQLHDVLIVGGGLVGASLAIALDQIGMNIGLVEVTPPGRYPRYSMSVPSVSPQPQ